MRTTYRVVALVTAGLTSIANAADLYGVGSYDGFSTQGLYHIDTVTGGTTLIGDTGLAGIIGIAYDFDNSVLLAYTDDAALFEIDLSNGSSLPVSGLRSELFEGDLAFGPDGTLFAVTGTRFGAVDLLTGAFDDLHGLSAADVDISGLAIDATGIIYAYQTQSSGTSGLIRVFGDLGFASSSGLPDVDGSAGVAGMDFDPDGGELYLSNGLALFTIDPVTGGSTYIGDHDVSGMSGIAFVPAPSAVVLLACGMAVMRRRD
jgi:DNA-binding beta-propeller fold protein YncE